MGAPENRQPIDCQMSSDNRQRHTTPWSQEEEEHLKLCIEIKMTSGEIAKSMPGRTRNAIMGRLFRKGMKLHYSKDGEAVKELKVAQKTRRYKTAKVKISSYIESSVFNLPSQKMVSLYDLKEGQCVCPVSKTLEMMFCGEPIEQGYPYCQHHRKILFKKVKGQLYDQA